MPHIPGPTAIPSAKRRPGSLEANALVARTREKQIAELREFLRQDTKTNGRRRIELPDQLYRLLTRIIQDLADGKPVSLTTAKQDLTTQQAANFLGVSRQFLVRLLDQKQIPFHRVGTHRRLHFQDLVAFRSERDRRRHQAIRRMARDAVKQGVYDDF